MDGGDQGDHAFTVVGGIAAGVGVGECAYWAWQPTYIATRPPSWLALGFVALLLYLAVRWQSKLLKAAWTGSALYLLLPWALAGRADRWTTLLAASLSLVVGALFILGARPRAGAAWRWVAVAVGLVAVVCRVATLSLLR